MPNPPNIDVDQREAAWRVWAENCPPPFNEGLLANGYDEATTASKHYETFLGWDTKPDEHISNRYHMLLGPHGAAIVKAWYIKKEIKK